MPDRIEPTPAELPLPGGREGATVRVHPLHCGGGRWPDAWPHRRKGPLAKLRALGFRVPRSEWVDFPFVAYLVEHPQAGPFLIDTGFDASVIDDPHENLGRLLSAGASKPVVLEQEHTVPAHLRERGLTPNDVRLVVMTHLHYDHSSGIGQFPRATFLVNEVEWHTAHQAAGVLKGYAKAHFDHPFDWRGVNFERAEVSSYSTFGRTLDLFGDGSVRLVSTPGHTRGHMSVLMRTAAHEVLAIADAAYTLENVHNGHLPAFMDDEHLYRRSIKEIQLYARQKPEAVLIPGHDGDAWATVEPIYE